MAVGYQTLPMCIALSSFLFQVLTCMTEYWYSCVLLQWDILELDVPLLSQNSSLLFGLRDEDAWRLNLKQYYRLRLMWTGFVLKWFITVCLRLRLMWTAFVLKWFIIVCLLWVHFVYRLGLLSRLSSQISLRCRSYYAHLLYHRMGTWCHRLTISLIDQ